MKEGKNHENLFFFFGPLKTNKAEESHLCSVFIKKRKAKKKINGAHRSLKPPNEHLSELIVERAKQKAEKQNNTQITRGPDSNSQGCQQATDAADSSFRSRR